MSTTIQLMLLLGFFTIAACAQSTGASVTKLEVIAFESSVSDMQSALEGQCSSVDVRTIEPSPIPDVTDYRQIDCRGFFYFGGERLAEFVFLNDRLMLVWILVEPDEIDALEDAFVDQLGQPDITSNTIKLFTEHNAGVRRDVPEALYYAEYVAPMVEAHAAAGD